MLPRFCTGEVLSTACVEQTILTEAVQCRRCLFWLSKLCKALQILLSLLMQVTVCAVDPSSDQLTPIQLPADASLTDAAQLLGNALTEDDSSVQQYWVNLDPESQDDVIPRLPHGDPIFEINLVLLSARPGGKRCVIALSTQMATAAVDHLSTLLHLLTPCTGYPMGCRACLDLTRQFYSGTTALVCYEEAFLLCSICLKHKQVVSIRLSCLRVASLLYT